MSNLDDLKIDRGARRVKRHGSWLIPTVSVSLLMGAVAITKWSRERLVQVRTAVVREVQSTKRGTVLNGSGYIVARRVATPSSKITGKVTEVLVEEGMKVKEGQILARLDSPNLSASLRLAEAQHAAAKSALKEVSVRLAEAQKALERMLALADADIAPKAGLDETRAQVDSLVARLDHLRDQVAVADRQVDIWKQQMEDTVIHAPFTGVVVAKNAQPGEMISPIYGGGFTRSGICTIVDMDSLEIEVDVNESVIDRVKPGQAVKATLDAYADWKIPCRVLAVIPTADRAKSTVKVRVGLPGSDPRILPSMAVKVAFQGDDHVDNSVTWDIAVPSSAIRLQDGKETVFVVHDGRLEWRRVTVGPKVGSEVVVLTGLTNGELVVMEGPVDLKTGDAVADR